MMIRNLSRALRASLLLILMTATGWAVPVGDKAPDFSATDTNGKLVKLSELKGKLVVLKCFNHGCPFVRAQYDPGKMQALQKKWTDQGVVWISICSSAPGKQCYMETAKEADDLRTEKDAHPSHVVLDPDCTIGRLYEAKATPHVFVISKEGTLLYNGAIDDKAGTNHLDQALGEVSLGKAVSVPLIKSYGCSVKY